MYLDTPITKAIGFLLHRPRLLRHLVNKSLTVFPQTPQAYFIVIPFAQRYTLITLVTNLLTFPNPCSKY